MGRRSKSDHAYIDSGRPDAVWSSKIYIGVVDGRKSSFYYHVGYRSNIEWLNYEELRICETHMSPVVPDAAKMMPDGQRSINQRFHACSHDNTCPIL